MHGIVLLAAELCGLHKNYPQVLFPAFRIQANLMQVSMGQAFWIKRREIIGLEKSKEQRRAEEAKAAAAKEKRRMQMAYVTASRCRGVCCGLRRRLVCVQ